MSCPRCGGINPEGFRYCGHCGSELDDTRLSAGERRHLTVMFCDLVGSTEMAEAVDPEEARDFVHRYQVECSEIIERHGGFLARFIGDGVLAYFGYPQAHEDDAARAVRAGLEVVDAIGRLSPVTGLGAGAPPPAARVAVDTGEVVISDMAAGRHRQSMEVVGRAPNVAARLQGMAPPGWVVLTDATARLVEGFAVLEPQGEWELRGLARPVPVYRAVRTTLAQARFDVAASRGLTPLAGRAEALDQLARSWQRVAGGDGAVALVVGDAGIGKTRLVHELLSREVGAEAIVVNLHCLPDHQSTPLHPIVRELVVALGRRGPDQIPALKAAISAAGINDEDAPGLFAEMLGIEGFADDHAPAPTETSARRKLSRTLTLLQRWLIGVGADHALVIVVENLHWADPSTLELLTMLVAGKPSPGVLVVMTARSEFRPPWNDDDGVLNVTLARLSAGDVMTMVESLVGAIAVMPSVIDDIVERADGVPLFVEELTRAVVDGDGEKTREQVPATLHDSLLARLDRLGRGREVVGVAAVIGREFAASQVQRIAGLDADALGGWLTMLVGSGVIRPASESGPGTYRFKHALVRDAAYQSLLLTDRRRLHQAVADDLRAYRPAAGEAEPEVLARHYGEAGQFEAAARFWRRAARRAEGRGSLPEAVECAQAAISMLERLPASAERDERELSLLLRLGFMLYQRFGGGDERIGHILERTRKMASGNPGAQAFVLGLAATVFHDRAEHEQNVDVTSELIALAEDAGDPYWKMAAYAAAATPRLELGRVSEAEAVLDRFLEHYRPEMHVDAMTDPAINGHTERAWVRWHRGQPDLAIAGLEELIASLPESALRYARAHLAIVMAMLRVLRREPDEARRHALVAASFADEHSLDHIDCHAQFILGWEAATRGEGDSAVDMVSSALDRHRALGIRSGRERGLTMLALACQAAGRVADARAALHEGQALALETGARREAPELWRIEAELALADGLPDRAVALAGQAATMARDSESLGYELRALTTLAQLQPNATTVRDELSAVYAAFRDGHTTADLRDAALALGLQQPNGWPGVTLDAPGVKDQRST